MTENPAKTEEVKQTETLESEVKAFIATQPYWAQFLATKIQIGTQITEDDINISYSYLLEELSLKDKTVKPEIPLDYTIKNTQNYKDTIVLSKLENIEGVNALLENQALHFSPNITIVFGSNGSGKSGYVRLLKKAFYSKAEEDILPNIYQETGHKPIKASFTFQSTGKELNREYPIDKADAAFDQFAVFDGKCVIRHLDHKNQFEFRPAGLSFFAEYTEALKKIEAKISLDFQTKQSTNELAELFDGDSEIKTAVQNLSADTNIADIKKHTPFSDTDKTAKETIEKDYDNLLLASKGKEKEIKTLSGIKQLIESNKLAIEKLNCFFNDGYLTKIRNAITDCVNKETTARHEGMENFTTDKIEKIGSDEWKQFIASADKFAKVQKKEDIQYPGKGDNCLLCLQPLSGEAHTLIVKYWAFIKSEAESNAKAARAILEQTIDVLENLNLDLFPAENTLTAWLTEKYPIIIQTLTQDLTLQKQLVGDIISDVKANTANIRLAIQVNTDAFKAIIAAIDTSISTLRDNKTEAELARLLKEKTALIHKEKLNIHFSKIQLFIDNQVWINKASKVDWGKRTITDTEKRLSGKYFNQKYIDTFNQECLELKGNFGIIINHTGSGGTSYKQLFLKGKNPSAILSEGEQKAIAIADFLSEMKLSEINKGIIFDDPVNSLDNERKKNIAEKLVNVGKNKQVIIFTHDLVFFYHLKNCSKKILHGMTDSFMHHTIEREDQTSTGKIILNYSPANEGQYNEPTKAKEWLSKSKTVPANEKLDCVKAGLSSLRATYEALAIFTIMGGAVQRFDPQIRMGRLKDIKYNKSLIDTVIEKHGEISDLIEAHLHSDEFGVIPTAELLEQHIIDFVKIKEQIKAISDSSTSINNGGILN